MNKGKKEQFIRPCLVFSIDFPHSPSQCATVCLLGPSIQRPVSLRGDQSMNVAAGHFKFHFMYIFALTKWPRGNYIGKMDDKEGDR